MIESHDVSISELRDFVGRLGVNEEVSNRCSGLFLLSIYAAVFSQEPFGDPAKIVAEVLFLEGDAATQGTRAPDQFERAPLNGLWRKHYLFGRVSLARNIQLAFGQKDRPVLRKVIKENRDPRKEVTNPREAAGELARAVTNLYLERKERDELTGEYIIFAKHEGRNCYLTLSTHDECRNRPEELLQRIRMACIPQFPFLENLLSATDSTRPPPGG